MNGTITIRLDNGTMMHGSVTLSDGELPPVSAPVAKKVISSTKSVVPALDFTLPLRPFMNDYADGLSGSKKLALLVAHFAKGELDVPVDRAEVIDTWNKMTGLLGGKFNGAHESRAKDSGFIYVPQTGKLALVRKWLQVFD